MQQRYRFVGPFMLALTGSALSVAQAQPDPNQTPKGVNPPQAEPAPIAPGGIVGGWIKPGDGGVPLPMVDGGRIMTMQITTPMQMQEALARQQLQAAGFTDKVLQDAVVAFMQAQEKARGPLRAKAQDVDNAMWNNATTDAQMLTLTSALRIAIEDEKTRSEAALKALDAQIGYTKKPRLEAFLLMRGLLDDATAYVGNTGNLRPEYGLNNLTPFLQVAPNLEWGQQLGVPGALEGLPELRQNVTPNYYFALPGNGAQVWAAPAVPGNALRAYNVPRFAKPGAVTPPIGIIVTPPVVPPGDVIAPPVTALDNLTVTPPQTPVPLALPQENALKR